MTPRRSFWFMCRTLCWMSILLNGFLVVILLVENSAARAMADNLAFVALGVWQLFFLIPSLERES